MTEKLLGKDENIKRLEEGFILVSPYTNVLDAITAQCKTCGYEDTKTARTFIRSGCTNCRRIANKKNKIERIQREDDEYLARINVDEDEFEIHKYRQKRKDILEVKHKACGEVYKVDNRYVKLICGKCNPDKLIDADWYREKYAQLKADGYEVTDVIYGEYNKSRGRTTTIKLKHNECGHEFTRNSVTLKTPEGHFCPLCVEGKRLGEINEETIQSTIVNILGEDYEYFGGLVDSVEPFQIRHKPCGTVYTKRLSSIRIGSGRCPACKKKFKIQSNVRNVKHTRR